MFLLNGGTSSKPHLVRYFSVTERLKKLELYLFYDYEISYTTYTNQSCLHDVCVLEWEKPVTQRKATCVLLCDHITISHVDAGY